MILVDTFVAGRPKTKGSLTFITPGYATDSDGSRHWRALMAGAVRDSYRARWAELMCTGPYRGCGHGKHLACGLPQPHAGPVLVRVMAHLPVDPLAHGAGDLDKLLRNVLDALDIRSKNPKFRGGAIIDDNQVTRIEAEKRGPAERTGVWIAVETLDSTAPVR